MSDMDITIQELRKAAASINDIASWLAMQFNKSEPAPKLEEVRAVLAEKSRAGQTAQVRELLLKYGADRLSGIDPAKYSALLSDAEGLNNAT